MNINPIQKIDVSAIEINGNIGVFMLIETKFDNTFSLRYFFIAGYTLPYMFNRDCNVDNVLLFVWEGLLSKLTEIKLKSLRNSFFLSNGILENTCEQIFWTIELLTAKYYGY